MKMKEFIVTITIIAFLMVCLNLSLYRSNNYAQQRNDLYFFVILHANGYTLDEFVELEKQIGVKR
jgi:hypothetical protein